MLLLFLIVSFDFEAYELLDSEKDCAFDDFHLTCLMLIVSFANRFVKIWLFLITF